MSTTYPATPLPGFTRRSLPRASGDDLTEHEFEFSATGERQTFASIDTEDQERWMRAVLNKPLHFPITIPSQRNTPG